VEQELLLPVAVAREARLRLPAEGRHPADLERCAPEPVVGERLERLRLERLRGEEPRRRAPTRLPAAGHAGVVDLARGGAARRAARAGRAAGRARRAGAARAAAPPAVRPARLNGGTSRRRGGWSRGSARGS